MNGVLKRMGSAAVRKMVVWATALMASVAVGGPLGVHLTWDGTARIGTKRAELRLTVHHEKWLAQSFGIRRDCQPPDRETGTAAFELFSGSTKTGHGLATLLPTDGQRAVYAVSATAEVDLKPEATVLSLTLPAAVYAGGTWQVNDGAKNVLPKNLNKKNFFVMRRTVRKIAFVSADGSEPFALTFPVPVSAMIQDDRLWGPTFTLRIHADGKRAFLKGEQRAFLCVLSSPDGVRATTDQPVVIARGADWIPLDYRKNIEEGSALDFSGMGLQDAPAGKYGWLKNEGGHFAFEGRPGVPQRFYGVNLCFDANFPDQAQADEFVTRLVRLGYNTIRLHHFEKGLIKGSPDRLALNAEMVRRLDYLVFRAIEKGLYVTTDLFTSRPVMWRDLAIDRDGQVPMQVYKNLIGVYEPAFENWKAFARNLLTHVNPYTGRRYADEPAMPLISLINEGYLLWCWTDVSRTEQMQKAWQTWLAKKRAADPSFAEGVSTDATKVPFWGNAALVLFMTEVEDALAARQRAFLRSLGVKALLTSQNCGSHYAPLMAMREKRYDYVDDHFYVDHPNFLVRSWALPSRCPNKNPVLTPYLAPVSCAYTRMPSKPFCVTEWNFSGPGMFRGVGGIMTGAMAALQAWDGLWRFAYSHNIDGLRDRTGAPGYFDMGSDPLGQASDRASICLFLRGDMAPLTDKLALTVTPDTFMPTNGRPASIVPAWCDAAWQTQVGTSAGPVPAGVKTFRLSETRANKTAPVPLAPNAALAFDRTAGRMTIDTPRTAGGFTPHGALAAGPLSFDVGEVPATVWASSLDGQPLARSARILVTHLTDVQANGNVYADQAKTILLKWGTYPPVVRNGSALVALALDAPDAYDVWSLDTTGRRLGKVATTVQNGRLSFTAAVEGPAGARMLYEVVRRK